MKTHSSTTVGSRVAAVSLTALAVLGTVGASAPLDAQSAATVTVDNTRAVPLTVYLERGRFDLRLGTVMAHTKSTLDLPHTVVDGESIRIVVHPDGSGTDLMTPDLTVKKGKAIDVYVPTNDNGFVPPPPPETIPDPGPGTTTVTVENERDQMVTVFVERGAIDVRIGTVAAHQKATLTLPSSLTRDPPSVEIFVHPELGQDLASQTFALRPGAHLLVKVPHRG